ncbi:hypothetical protein FNL39_102610 [Nocardia caishijiensis]|uniref:Uncharacterized protein n=1 Tax=Nocardia caishijiensis TaxID=184756 RepID=A0ABQ6YRN2_9NOCA|nr:hypothetical protein FNL39_102610 [Nocardia caishijiensis]
MPDARAAARTRRRRRPTPKTVARQDSPAAVWGHRRQWSVSNDAAAQQNLAAVARTRPRRIPMSAPNDEGAHRNRGYAAAPERLAQPVVRNYRADRRAARRPARDRQAAHRTGPNRQAAHRTGPGQQAARRAAHRPVRRTAREQARNPPARDANPPPAAAPAGRAAARRGDRRNRRRRPAARNRLREDRIHSRAGFGRARSRHPRWPQSYPFPRTHVWGGRHPTAPHDVLRVSTGASHPTEW